MPELPSLQLCDLPSGQKMAWREWGAGTPLIMLHGWSMSSVVFSEVAPLFAGHYRVLCPDLPGHGQSEPLAEYQLSSFATAIEVWAAQVAAESTALLGWSLGGQVALQMAAAGSLEIDKLLLIATTPRFCQSEDWPYGLPVTQLRALDRNLGRAYEKTLGDFFNQQFAADELTKERYRQILGFAVRPGQLPQADQARKALTVLGQEDLRQLLSEVRQPALVMHGALDQIIPLGAGEYLAAELPNARLCRLSDVGHAPFFSQPREAVKQCLSFLQ